MAVDKTNDAYWAKLHELYSDKDWATKPSMFFGRRLSGF
jgi:hypothetical protein